MFLLNIIKDKYLRIVLAVSFAAFIITAISASVKFFPHGQAIVLHFDPYRGIDYVGSRLDLLGIMLSGFVMLVINFLLADFIYTRERFFSYVLSFGSLLLSMLFVAALSIIASVN